MTQKSIAQRALDATYPAERLSSCVSAAYWLASCHEDQATVMAVGRMQEAEERLAAIAEAMGFKIERIASEVDLGPVTKVKMLEWPAGYSVESRSSLGDLYSVTQLSENVWVTLKNGTAFQGWRSSSEAAKAAAQADFERVTVPAVAEQAEVA